MTTAPTAISPPIAVGRIVVAVWTVALVVAAVVPTNPVALSEGHDLWAHGAGYGVHALLVFWVLSRSRAVVRGSLLSVGATTALGSATEILQSLVPGRDASGTDLLADAAGATFGVAIGLIVLRIRRSGRPPR